MKSLITQALYATSTFALEYTSTKNASSTDRPCPTEIRQTIPAPRGAPFTSMADIHAAMLKCPDVTTLQVRATLLGCSEWPDRFNFPFDVRGGERYPSAPRILSLDGYDADEREHPSCRASYTNSWDARLSLISHPIRAWSCLSLPAAQRTKTNLDLWLDAMDFSQIHTLQLNDTHGRYTLTEQVVQKLAPKLTSLESLLVHNAIGGQFISALHNNTLKHLTWRNPEGGCVEHQECDSGVSPLQRILQRQGSTLRSLEYRTDEWETRALGVLRPEDLYTLFLLAPNLNSLTLNLKREHNGDGDGGLWPWERLRSVAEGLPQLADLTIYFELTSGCQRERGRRERPWSPGPPDTRGCDGFKRYAQPMLNRTSAAEMARYLWKHKAGQPLGIVTFRAGDWTPPWDGPLASFGWLHGQRVWYTCKMGTTSVEERSEDGPTSGIVCEGEEDLSIYYDRYHYGLDYGLEEEEILWEYDDRETHA